MELLTDQKVAEKVIRVEVVSIFFKRLTTSKNELLLTFDEIKVETFSLLVDANNVHGGVMKKFHLPLRHFEWANEFSLDLIANTSKASLISFNLEVKLPYANFHLIY